MGAILPVLLTLGDFLLVPHFLSRSVCLFWRHSDGARLAFQTQTLIMRFSPITYLLLRFAYFSIRRLLCSLYRLYCEIRDEKYLVRKELCSREPSTASDIPVL